MAITNPSAKIILDSISPSGQRLTTMEVVMHRFILAEFNTHRVFSRNSASSRAIPIEKRIKDVLETPAMPLEWGSNKPGMQAGEELDLDGKLVCQNVWLKARDYAVRCAKECADRGLHKQVANRLLEPFLWHKALVSSTEWENFFAQRASPLDGTKSLAQPEMVALADAMRDALNASSPVVRGYHLPYVMLQSDEVVYLTEAPLEELKLASTGFCASTSTYNHDGSNMPTMDAIKIGMKLKNATPPHMSPFEHVAAADETNVNDTWCADGCIPTIQKGNFTSWRQYRYEVFGR